ncbi:hypothetical protein NMY22_g5318 [Coprinellus aureogranulatus]|nr:hypothetical protein NMY22_g5318 [Coprinellus aureogranulatus]
MSASCHIPSNPDISGIGVRFAIYLQNLLCFLPAIWAIWDGHVSDYELESAETRSTTNLVLAFAILISCIVQALILAAAAEHDIPLIPLDHNLGKIHRRRRLPFHSDSEDSDIEPFDAAVFSTQPLRRIRRAIPKPSPRNNDIISAPAAAPLSTMTNKIIPSYPGPPSANGIRIWLGQVEDGFDNYEDTHKDAKLSVKTRIRLTGTSLLDPQMAEWWSMGRKEYQELATWDSFVAKLKDRFLPVDWKTDALERFYTCQQGKRDFRVFAAELVQHHTTLPSGTISNTIFKYHLFFFSHPQLYLRMRAIPNFNLDCTSTTTDQLIALMAAQWDSLVADTTVRSSRAVSSTAVSSNLRTGLTAAPASASPAPPRLTDEEKALLSAQNACWNCRRKPGDPDWTPHNRTNCPGNPSIGARPGRDYVAPSTVAGVTSVLAAAVIGRSDSPEFYSDAHTSDKEEVEGMVNGNSDSDDDLF